MILIKMLRLLLWLGVFTFSGYCIADIAQDQWLYSKDYLAIEQNNRHFEKTLGLVRYTRQNDWFRLWKNVCMDGYRSLDVRWLQNLQTAHHLTDSSLHQISRLQQQGLPDPQELGRCLQELAQQWKRTDSLYLLVSYPLPERWPVSRKAALKSILINKAKYDALRMEDQLAAKNMVGDGDRFLILNVLINSLTPVVEEGSYYEAIMSLQYSRAPIQIQSINGQPLRSKDKPVFEHQGQAGINQIEIPVVAWWVYGDTSLLIKKSYLRP